MYKVNVNGEHEREIDLSGKGILLDGKSIAWDQTDLGNDRFHILMNNRSYLCEILSADPHKKSFEIKINGATYRVRLKDRFDELLHHLGMDKVTSLKVNVIKAPMPGLVLKLMVKGGEQIKEGDSLLILEAMKMENVIKSPGAGIVKMVRVKERDAVEKNQVLVELI